MSVAQDSQRELSRDFICPHCRVHSLHLFEVGHLGPTVKVWFRNIRTLQPYYRETKLLHHIYRCVKCKGDTYLLIRPLVETEPEKIMHQYPIPMPMPHESVPVEVERAAIEAEKCLSVQAPNACGVMARRAIHALCRDKKAQGDNLYDQLKFLRDSHEITPDLWQWAEELRIVGRSGAHPEWEDVTLEEAAYAVRFLEEIIKYVYINPYEFNQRKLKETKKKKDDPPTDAPLGAPPPRPVI